MDAPLRSGNWPVMGPSPMAWSPENQVPRQMTRGDMDKVKGEFARAAEMAQRVGFDMLELHYAHGYLMSAFITPLTNHRTDDYGGSLENRMRFPLEVLQAVRAVWPSHKPISVRISANDWVGSDGITPDDAVAIARLLRAAGVDIIDVSAGQTSINARPIYGRMFQTPFSDRIRNEVGIATDGRRQHLRARPCQLDPDGGACGPVLPRAATPRQPLLDAACGGRARLYWRYLAQALPRRPRPTASPGGPHRDRDERV